MKLKNHLFSSFISLNFPIKFCRYSRHLSERTLIKFLQNFSIFYPVFHCENRNPNRGFRVLPNKQKIFDFGVLYYKAQCLLFLKRAFSALLKFFIFSSQSVAAQLWISDKICDFSDKRKKFFLTWKYGFYEYKPLLRKAVLWRKA